jgi:hypothetical protein
MDRATNCEVQASYHHIKALTDCRTVTVIYKYVQPVYQTKMFTNNRQCFALCKYVDNTEHRTENELNLRILETKCQLSEREAHTELYSENPKEEAT